MSSRAFGNSRRRGSFAVCLRATTVIWNPDCCPTCQTPVRCHYGFDVRVFDSLQGRHQRISHGIGNRQEPCRAGVGSELVLRRQRPAKKIPDLLRRTLTQRLKPQLLGTSMEVVEISPVSPIALGQPNRQPARHPIACAIEQLDTTRWPHKSATKRLHCQGAMRIFPPCNHGDSSR